MHEKTPDPGDGAILPRGISMPRGIPFIITTELGERFCYYGINAILSVYLTRYLQRGEAEATTIHSLFKSGAYFFPLLGAVIADVFWGKTLTILVFSLVYSIGCVALAAMPGGVGLAVGLTLIALGTGGIKPCVSTAVGDQFTRHNQHLASRAFAWFYLAINAGLALALFACPLLLDRAGPRAAFGLPAAAMLAATAVFASGRARYTSVPPAGTAWLREILSPAGLKTVCRLLAVYAFVAVFWALWDQSNGQTWTLQAQSDLMDKTLGLGVKILPAQVQGANGFFILALIPLFDVVVYPRLARVVALTPLRKIAAGLFFAALAFVIVAWIDGEIGGGRRVSVWWQIGAYLVLTVAEVLVSPTILEFSYQQAPLRLKSFIMALCLLSTTAGNLLVAGVSHGNLEKIEVSAIETGGETWIHTPTALAPGQKIEIHAAPGLVVRASGESEMSLSGTYLITAVDAAHGRAQLTQVTTRAPVESAGQLTTRVEAFTYRLQGPRYFYFFALLAAGAGAILLAGARFYRGETYFRD